MRTYGTELEFSASDLARHGACRHLTALDLSVAQGLLPPPPYRADPALEALAARGLAHERHYVDTLRAEGLTVLDLTSVPPDAPAGTTPESATLAALATGADLLVQPTLRDPPWFGRPDLLRRVSRPASSPSRLGTFSYEVIDTKLASETRGATILQLAVYSDLLARAQGVAPEHFHVVTPDPRTPAGTREEHYRVADFAAYYRLLCARLLASTREDPAALVTPAASTYPEPVEHCDVCRWWSTCNARRRADDHLSLVAGISRLQRRELSSRGITTLAALAALPVSLPSTFAPKRGSRETYVRVREQARLQLDARTRGAPAFELLPVAAAPAGKPDEHGLARLPLPSPGDVFLDLEGDPFARDGGREYLFGLAVLGAEGANARCTYERHWAHTDTEESAAFDAVVRAIVAAWTGNPGMHVYHYAPYEPATLKRLMGRYASHEADIDRMLRAGLFVDLYGVVKNAVRCGVEKYSIKDLEVFYASAFTRELDLREAGKSRRIVERALELGATDVLTDAVRLDVEAYNRDDCLSARALRDWLEGLRADAEKNGTPFPRPAAKDGEAPEIVRDREQRIAPLLAALKEGVPLEPAERTAEQQARWLLAALLEWHRRESKVVSWERYRLRDLPDDELLDERAILAGMTFVERLTTTKRGAATDRYTFPPQDLDVRAKTAHLRDEAMTPFGTVEAFDAAARTIDIKKVIAQADVHPPAIFLHTRVNTDDLEDAIERIAADVVQHGLQDGTRYRVARELLQRRPPRVHDEPFVRPDGETPVHFARRIAPHLDRTVLPIQGPPGAGKTFTGAKMICDLVRSGQRVGITATSHKVIHHLLEAVVKAAREDGVAVRCVEKVKDLSDPPSPIEELTDNDEVLARLADGRANVAGGTAWLWSSEAAFDAVDVLFVDEAGQLSLANVLAASQAAGSVVLLGDPQQLEQPQQGSHPDGAGVSVLEHALGGHATMPADRGIFLAETWRLAPAICELTSELFYEGRLVPAPGCAQQVLAGTSGFDGAGLWVVPVPHDGNRNSSPEEAVAIDHLIASLLTPAATWTHRDGTTHPLTPADILVVAPYNAHVTLLTSTLSPRAIPVGTVDKFQGQEAPVVIYAMATSTPEDAPRGMEFLYSLNRLNVATSRARCACIVVASPKLFERLPDVCRTPGQMRLGNAMCRYRERARRGEGC